MLNFPKQKLMPFLSFNGKAEEAMNYYAGVFGATIESVVFYEEGTQGEAGKVMNGTMDFDGAKLLFLDMSAEYPAPDFSWATSLILTYDTEAAFDKCFAGISQGGTVMMEPMAVGGIRKCCWVTDKYGVTWQLVWP